ncbi:MAG: NAD(P)/FAD-dependent oxidoreductase [Candidatus Aenigmatarchaeota archaeon]
MVSIIGGGPAGATCAYYLAKGGVNVTLYEARPNERKPCAGGLRKEIFDRYGHIVGQLKGRAFCIKNFTLSFDYASKKMTTKNPIGYIIDRLEFDKRLRRVAKAAGCKIVHRAVGINDVKDDVIIDARGAYPSEKNALAIITICKMENPEFKIEFISKYSSIGYFWVFPLSKGRANIGVGEFGRARLDKLNEGLNWYIKKHDAKILWKKSWHESTALNKEIVVRKPDGTLIIKVGERAGLVNPLLGEGIYYAMRSGEMLAAAIVNRNMWLYMAYVKWTEFKFMVYKLLRDIVLLPIYKPALGFAGARLVCWKVSR